MIKGLLKRLGRRKQNNAAVLMYHRISDEIVDPWDLCVSKENFDLQLSMLQQHFRVLSIPDLLVRLKENNLQPRSVAISFDDAYADNYLFAKPLLEKYNCPATFFVPTYFTGKQHLFWWDELAYIFLRSSGLPGTLDLKLGEQPLHFQIQETDLTDTIKSQIEKWRWPQPAPNQRCALYLSIWEKLKPLSIAEIEQAVIALRHWTNADYEIKAEELPINRMQLQDMLSHDLFTAGLHTHTHLALSRHDQPVQTADIQINRDVLKGFEGKMIDVIAYPHGDYDNNTLQTAQSLGLNAGFSTQGYAFSSSANMFCLGRTQVKNYDGQSLQSHLEYLFEHPMP
jgi:peptidoglycan/xylan/chitin deacetylase (PgdA/CDA1 family)